MDDFELEMTSKLMDQQIKEDLLLHDEEMLDDEWDVNNYYHHAC